MAFILGGILGWIGAWYYHKYMVITWPRAAGNAKGPPMLILRGGTVIDPSGGSIENVRKSGRRAALNMMLVKVGFWLGVILIITNSCAA